MANLDTFRTLQEDSADKSYPRENSDIRHKAAKHARELIARMRQADVAADIIAAGMSEGSGRKFSEGASKTTVSGIITAADKVVLYMDEQQEKFVQGETVTLLEGSARHLLGDVFEKLYFEMKTHYTKVAKGHVDEEGKTLIPDSGKVKDVDDMGPAIIKKFLLG